MRLSVLITYHNEGAWLTECLNSIVPQLAATDEVIIYDDASRVAAAGFIVDDARLRVIRGGNNVGPSRARNELLRASAGTHVHFHDADDLFTDGWRTRIEAAFQNGVDMVITDASTFDENGKRSGNIIGVADLERGWGLLKFALRRSVLPAAASYKREIVEAVGGYRDDLWQSEDFDLHVRIALMNPNLAVIPEDLVHIRKHPNQRSRLSSEVWISAIDALQPLVGQIPAHARADAAYAATRAGSVLLSEGSITEAHRAFDLAQKFGGPTYDKRAMQRLSSIIGAKAAERMAAWYRTMLPNALRMRLQRRSS